jgi:hypothetical protein
MKGTYFVRIILLHDMLGRVFSLIGAVATAMMPLSLLVTAPISGWLGVRTWYSVGGVLCSLFTLVAFTIPEIIKLNRTAQNLFAKQ